MTNELFRKVEKGSSKERTNIYDKFGFNRNPFPNKPSITIDDNDERNNGSIYLPELREKENTEFEKICMPNPQRGESSKIISFLMDYATRRGRGIGKTSFLNYQRNRILVDFGKALTNESEVMLSVYHLPKPGENYKKFYSISRFVIESLIDQELVSLTIARLRAFSGTIDPDVLEFVTKDNIKDTIGDNSWLIKKHKELGKPFDQFELQQSVKMSLINQQIDAELAKTLAQFGQDSEEFKNYYYIKQKEAHWKKEANNVLYNDLVKVFRLAGFTKCLILFDELEKVIPKLNSLERRDFCESLRYFFMDGQTENTKHSFYHILLTIHPYLQELLLPHWEASGLQRFASLGGELTHDYTIYFEPLDEGNAIPLAIAYMDKSRIKLLKEGADIHPFTHAALIEALKRTLGVPGRYLSFLHSAIEKAAEHGWQKIDTDEIAKVETPIMPSEKDAGEDDAPLAATKVKL